MDRSQARFDSGLTVESDLLTARVRMAARLQEVIRARNTLEVAQAQLNTAMGMPLDSPFQLTGALAERPPSIPAVQDVEKQALTNRPDLKRIASEEAAQRQSVSAAKSSFGPRVNAFAGREMDNPTFVAGGGGNNWLGGVEVQFDIFQGGAKPRELPRHQPPHKKVSPTNPTPPPPIPLQV